MTGINVEEMAVFMNANNANGMSFVVRSKAGLGVLYTIQKVFPDHATLSINEVDSEFAHYPLSALANARPGKTLVLDLDMAECVLSSSVCSLLLKYMVDGGRVIIVCNGEVTMEPPLLDRVISLEIQ